MKQGTVYLVGAGPGSPSLITVRGLDCIRGADVIVYDNLIDESLVQSAPPDAEKIYVGKMAGSHTLAQDDINELLVEKARSGQVVVRLKGGDPFLLGRGGEEAEALVENNIPFEVVPGVSSAMAVPAYAGIPVTHRGLASHVTVVTGHEDLSKAESSVPWDILAEGGGTLVILMGVGNLSDIVDKLMENGRPPSTPVAAIREGTWPGQQTDVGTLADIADKTAASGLRPPSVIVVGEVVGLREKLRWFDNLPLFGKRVLVTRAKHQAGALVETLAERGAVPVEMPVIDIQALPDAAVLDEALAKLEWYQWIVFTSVNGVEAFFRRMRALNLDARSLKGIKVGAIGPATASALERYGVYADYRPHPYTSEGLLAGLESQNIQGCRFLLPRADIASRELAEGIVRLGAEAHDVAVYRTVAPEEIPQKVKQMLLDGEIDIVTFASPSAVANLLGLMGEQRGFVQRATIACIGPVTTAEAARAGLAVDIVATEHTVVGLVEAIERHFETTRAA